MNDARQAPEQPQPKEDPEALVLRGRPRPALRFRRGLIASLTGAAAAGLVTLSWLALEPPSLRKAAEATDGGEPAHRVPTDALANAPGDYGDVPRLGPPLPGDLGRPILEQQRGLDAAQIPDGAPPAADQAQSPADSERERESAERASARTSAVLVQLQDHRSSAAIAEPAPQSGTALPAPPGEESWPGVPADQKRKIDFAGASGGDRNPHELRAAVSPWTVSAGTIIPASLITGLDSDLPGMVLAQVSDNVRDSATGRTVLIPQGARLIGRYDSVVAYGQRRALLVWTRIVFADGSSLDLDNLPATDSAGYSGLQDRVDSHGWQLLKGIALSTLLGVSTQLSFGGGGELARALRESTQQNAAHSGDQITSRNLDVQPTIRIRPGWPVRVLVDKDLVLQPWRG